MVFHQVRRTVPAYVVPRWFPLDLAGAPGGWFSLKRGGRDAKAPLKSTGVAKTIAVAQDRTPHFADSDS